MMVARSCCRTILMRFIVASAWAPPERAEAEAEAAATESSNGGTKAAAPVSAAEPVLEEGVTALSLAFFLSDFLPGAAPKPKPTTEAGGWSAAKLDEERALPAAAASIVDCDAPIVKSSRGSTPVVCCWLLLPSSLLLLLLLSL